MLKGLLTMDPSNQEDRDEIKLASELSFSRHRATRILIVAMVVMLVGLLSTGCFLCSSSRFVESARREILDTTAEMLEKGFRWNAYAARSLAGMLEKDLLGDGTSLESFSKIRAASFSIFKAIPLVTSIGATSANGLGGLYVREGGLKPEGPELGESSPVYIYSKSTGPHPPTYVEAVDIVTGDAISPAVDHPRRDEFNVRNLFATALSAPMEEVSWHLSQISGVPYIHFGIPVLTKESKGLVTVVHSSYNADAFMRHLLARLELQGGKVFVLNDVGEVVFTSEGDLCISKNMSELRCSEPEFEVVKALEFLRSRMQVNQLMLTEARFTDVLLGGRRHSLESWPHSFEGVNLAVVVMIPEQGLWRSISYRIRVASIAILLLALGVCFLGCFLFTLLVDQAAREVKLRDELKTETEARRRAEASRDAKTAFLSHMSHELRTPMACIIGLLDILMGELKMSEHQSSVRQVHRCATSLVALLNSALDIAKVEAGKLELEITEFDLEHELTSLIEVFSVSCDAKGLHLALQLSEDIPKLLKGDSSRVMQIFTNLIGNSVKFTSKGRIIVRGWVDNEPEDCHTSASGDREVKLKFEVDDTGPGIDASLRERVFENFVQAVTVPRTHGGTGLGLGIVRSLVHLMGGDIKIGDKVGDGTIFQFFLRFKLSGERTSSSYEVIKRREIILGLPEKDSRSVVAQWMEHRRLTVHQVDSWEDVSLQFNVCEPLGSGRKIDEKVGSKILRCQKEAVSEESPKAQSSLAASHNGSSSYPRRTKSDTKLKKPVLILDVELLPRGTNDKDDYAVALEKMGFFSESSNTIRFEQMTQSSRKSKSRSKVHAVVWVVASNTPDSLKNHLTSLSRTTCRSLVIRRPLHPSRLRELFSELEFRERNFQPEVRIAQSLTSITASSSTSLGKQLGVELYTDDETPAVDTHESGQASPISEKEEKQTNIRSTTGAGPVVLTETRTPEMQMRRNPLIRSYSDDTQKYIVESEMLLASRPLEGLNVLVAEDHVVLRMLASTLLKKLGAIPILSCNGQEAVNAVIARYESGKTPFDCILMDCQMPVMDGYDACNAIRLFEADKDQRTCIIALTANAMASDEQRCFLVGMDAFLTKPMEQERLVQVMLKCVSTLADSKSEESQVTGAFI